MTNPATIVQHRDSPAAVIAEGVYYGRRSYDLVGPLRRLYSDGAPAPPLLEQYVDGLRVKPIAQPSSLLASLPPGDNWLAQSSRSLARLHALFLIAEDPQERLVGRSAATLAHQASLVHHVLRSGNLTRVLIADEVGLGKTIEAGLIIRSLLEQRPGLRVLYLAPARLVRNVHREFREKLDLYFRQYSADDNMQADISNDGLVVASIHRAVHSANRERVIGTEPWDVIVVDECHHLSAHKPNGQDSNEQYDLVRTLLQRQGNEGRVILMSGTPHQGSRTRFDNLVKLLLAPGEQPAAARGRVIFRTKEDVSDWDGRPLFPKRDVRQPRVVAMGEVYKDWYAAISALYDDPGGSDARRRATGWARGQALQWAASSVSAGLGFLARLAIRRLGWTPDQRDLHDALLALRPYKNGSPDESAQALHARLVAEVRRQQGEQDVADMEELEEEVWRPDPSQLGEVLRQGRALMASPAATAKWEALIDLLDEAPNEKAVLFAQPVETVTALVRFLEQEYGHRPAVIVGGQTDDERDSQIRSFRQPSGPRLLVSSRAGGEGLNLQVARRLIHVDVPWNPMEMEQRVGRIHRFGSRRTIIVDTLVVEGTREVDAYRVARDKLSVAFHDLADDPQRFELLFSRVMSLVPPQQLEEVLGSAPPGPIRGVDADRLGELVNEGLRRWREFHDEFADKQRAIQALNPGAATWTDLGAFLIERGGAEAVSGYSVPDFSEQGGEIITVERPVAALRVGGDVYACADTRGGLASDSAGRSIPPLGLNAPVVSARLRAAVLTDQPTGAAWLRLKDEDARAFDRVLPVGVRRPCGLIAMLRQTVRSSGGDTRELGVELRVAALGSDGSPAELPADGRVTVIRALLSSTRQREPVDGQIWAARLADAETAMLPMLGQPASGEFETGVRHAIWPVLAAVVS